MTDGETLKIGDTVEQPIVTDRNYRYVVAENVVVTHMRASDHVGVELHALATETTLLTTQIEITGTSLDAPPVGKPVGLLAKASQVHHATVRLEAKVALDMAVSVLAHLKQHDLTDMDSAMPRIREALGS